MIGPHELSLDGVDELRRARDAAVAANAAKTRYLLAVSHELKSPLNTIYGYSQLLERDGAISPAEAGRVIRRSAEHLADLVEGLLEISRVESGVLKLNFEIVALPSFLDHIVDMFRLQAEAKGLAFNYVVEGKIPQHVRTDATRLRQILINLLSNAIKYTTEGKINISVSYRSEAAIITVADTGIGIEPEHLERIFEPFERGVASEAIAQPGIGLGLSIARLLARVLGGEISVQATPGKGSTFTYQAFLPQTKAEPEQRAEAAQVTGYEGPVRKTILVIDGDRSHLELMVDLLRPLGFDVFTALHPARGLALADLCEPDLVLLDLQIPAERGWELADQLRRDHGSALPIVLISSAPDEISKIKEVRSDNYAFVMKPIDLQSLIGVIGKQLGLEWQHGRIGRRVGTVGLQSGTAAYLDRLRVLATAGDLRLIEHVLSEMEAEFPDSRPVIRKLNEHVQNCDLRGLLKAVVDVDPR